MALFNCPKCAWRVKITKEDLGKKGKCMQCGQEYVIPSTFSTETTAAGKQAAGAHPPPIRPVSQDGPAGLPPWMKWLALALVAAALLVPAVFMVVTFAGREPAKPIVFGKVSFKNQPLTGGTIKFVGSDSVGDGKIGKDGSYEVIDPPTG